MKKLFFIRFWFGSYVMQVPVDNPLELKLDFFALSSISELKVPFKDLIASRITRLPEVRGFSLWLSMAAVAMATSLAIKPLRPLAGDQSNRKIHFLRPTRCSSASRLSLFPIASKKSESQGTFAASEESSYSVLAAVTSRYNEIVVLDTPGTRILLLDSSRHYRDRIQSVSYHWRFGSGTFQKCRVPGLWKELSRDEFASLPAIVPQGPIAILGLGAGTAAHLMLDLWPSRRVEGWEIDGILIDIAREYFALSDLERCTQANGSLSVHIGDALSPSAEVEGGFAGIIVDLFSEGKILPQLQEVTTWLDIEKKLMPHGRIMVNCGGAQAEITESGYIKVNGNISSKGSWVQNSTIQAMYRAFPGKLSWKRMKGQTSGNYLALTGPVLDLDAWSATLPHPLDVNVKDWRPCKLAG
ncbi:hypothetical protein IEQ34_022127 [Dendrobium chrysotoxum]|uniref:S-adenosyl-L-methionine-dependent methyltransferase n=1 Tax=Dendrobium chrysotoxum TaxID=161865 RepID=A0AAV7FY56_DENCH|nr:hypothetical protein IEQ34_022127 [Dendrobium chrysotoxum]